MSGDGGVLSPAEMTARLNPSHRWRVLSILAFPLVILLGVPWWWTSTSITRLSLPVDRIKALEDSVPPRPQTRILFTADEGTFPEPIYEETRVPPEEVIGFVAGYVHRGVDKIYKQRATPDIRDWELTPYHIPGEAFDLKMHLRLTDRANVSFPLEPYVQIPEKGLMTSGIEPGSLVVPVHPAQVKETWLREHYKIAMINSFLSLFPPEPPAIPLRVIKYQPNITLSFVLLNEDAAEGGYVRSWDIEGAIKDHFTPHLEPLKDIFNFTIEAQILYHAPLAFEPSYGLIQSKNDQTRLQLDSALISAEEGDEGAENVAKELIDELKEESGWGIDEDMMKVFVNSERWSLDSGSTNNPVLRFLLFVPSVHHRPMRLAVNDSADSFLLPQYGSVVLLNPPAGTSPETTFHLPSTALTPSFHLFTQHLYSLLALPPLPLSDKLHRSPPASPLMPPSELIPPLSPWQVNQVLRQRAKENSEEARKTLSGIVRLVAKIKEMKVGAGVRDKVLGAVERLEQGCSKLTEEMDKSTKVREQFILSRDAVALANQAFFDPSMMGLLYFPNEHKFAVYTPLFAPVGLPIVLGILKELIAWRRRRRAAKGKGKVSDETLASAVSKQITPDVLVETVDTASGGGAPVHPDVGDGLAGRLETTRTLRSRKSTP